ncbi:unnamed protein product, partial [Mesorhabditis spiculigera]
MGNIITCGEEADEVFTPIEGMHQPPPPANAIGWNMMHHSQSAGTLPRFPPQPQFAGPSNSPQIPPHRHTTEPRMTLDMPIPVMSTPPNSYHSHTFQNYGFNTPTIMYPQSPLMVHPMHLTTPCRQTPIPLGRVDFSPRPVHWNQDFLRNREQPTTSQPGSSKSEETTLSVPSPRQNEVYLAYARIKSPKRGTDGDLIDLSDGKDYDRIRRDFDVLYEPPPGDIAPSMPPAILSKTNSLHNDYVTTPTRRSEGAGTSKDDYEAVTPRRPASAIYPALKTQTPEKLSIDRFQIIEKKPDVEAQLERLVKRFGRTADCSQFFSSATVEYMTTNVKSVKVTIEKDHTWPTGGLRKLTQTVETDKTVGLFLAETLAALLDESQLADGVPTDAYGLKEYGLDEFLPEQELIGQNIFVGKCLLMDKDVKLEIGRKIPADRLPTDERPYTYADVRANKMSLASPTILDKDDVEQKLAQLKDNMEDFDSKAGDVHPLSVANSANGVRKRVEELCKLLSRIEPGTLHNTLRRYLTAEKNDRESARHDFLLAIHSFILAYCRSTTSSYTIRPLIEKKKPLKRVIECAEIVQVLVQSVHNLKNEWLSEYQSFFMTINLHHGTDDLGDWAYGWLPNIYPLIEGWTILSPVEAIQLLLPQYPDRVVRSKAVEWIRRASSDFLFNFMPQLVEVLRFELYEDSSLAELLLELSYKDLRFAKESALLTHSIYLQHKLLNTLDDLQRELKITTDSEKLNILRQRLGFLDGDLLGRNVRLPILPSFKATGIDVAKCGIFNSNAKPLRIVFRGLKSKFSVIHKDGDDMRQDALVIQLVRVMNDIWLCEGLDLRMITFRCATVGYRKGMAELVSDCQTLCDIQKAEGMAGVFKDDVLCKWLEKYNSSEYSYKVAEDNFRRSCAGWCVATFVLGIGDRHNDNILLTSMGHVFHIDFGKYMGDWQMAGPVKRDRVPFVFTKEMFAVINRGEVQGANDGYQSFIDFCCQAFNHLRSKHAHILSLLKIMQCSDIPGINAQSLHFVQKNLMLGMSDTDATAEFTKMITISLGSTFVRLNFFAHTFAQMLSGQTVRPIDQPDTLSFVPHRHTMETDGRIQDVKLLYPEKRMMPQKVYLYRMVVYRDQETIATTVYRSFAEFEELALKLKMRHHSSAPNWVKENARSNNREVALKRLSAMKDYLRVLLHGAPSAVRNDPLVYTFFHIILRDNTLQNGPEVLEPAAGRPVQIRLLLSWQATTSQLKVFVGHVKHLPMLTTGQAPDSYVKTYLRPDQNSKKKTKIVRSSLNPTFNEELCYDIGEVRDVKRFLDGHSLDVSIWSAGGLKDNNKMFHTQIQLHRLYNKTADRKGNLSWDDWHDLSKFGLHLPHS